MYKNYDVIIIGSGVIGSSVARELSKYKLKTAVLEKMPDVCCGTSARNSGVLHAGFNNKPGSKMARFCVEGNAGFDKLAAELDIPFRRTGKLIVGFTPEDREKLEQLKEQGEKNGVPGLKIVDKAFIKSKLPYVEGEFAMWSGSTAILSPFEYTIALAENACMNGVDFFFGHEVTGISDNDGQYIITAGTEDFRAKYVINCAGLYSDKIARMLGTDEYTIYPCKGEYYIFDKKLGAKLPVPAYPVPNIKTGGLGIHLTPSVEGNVFVGPSNEYIDDTEDYATEKDVLEMLIRDGLKIFPYLTRDMFIRNFTGIRPKLVSKSEGGYHDFVIERREETPRAINLIGIESPGLTSAQPIAREVAGLLGEVCKLVPDPDFNPYRKGIVTFRDKTPEEQAKLIEENPDYGEIICRCETITKAEVLAAINNPLGVHTVTGIKYRCRTMMGRCQGGYCQMRVTDLIQQETGCKPEEVIYNRKGAYIFTGRVR
ncbi:MAG: NAD(P)/FAD-dependent oxidoreductase [Lachnospiraceae bacterium]|nr:NAD(P)/FAD-dependent oxidoreductase [Lachnospiraceae bacterium]